MAQSSMTWNTYVMLAEACSMAQKAQDSIDQYLGDVNVRSGQFAETALSNFDPNKDLLKRLCATDSGTVNVDVLMGEAIKLIQSIIQKTKENINWQHR